MLISILARLKFKQILMICSLVCLLFGRAMSDQFATFRLDLLKFAVLPNK